MQSRAAGVKKEKPKRQKGSPQWTTRSGGRRVQGMGQGGEREIKVMMNGMGDVIVPLKGREEGKRKKKPTGLEEGENGREESGGEISLERWVVLGYWLSQHSGLDIQLYGYFSPAAETALEVQTCVSQVAITSSGQ